MDATGNNEDRPEPSTPAKRGLRRTMLIVGIAVIVLLVVAAVIYGLAFVILAPMM